MVAQEQQQPALGLVDEPAAAANNGTNKNNHHHPNNNNAIKTNGLLTIDAQDDENEHQGDHIKNETSFCSPPPEPDLINTKLPKELILKIFSFLDTVSLCRCAQVSKYWNKLALDGDNWQSVNLFDFRVAVQGQVVENLSARCGDFLKRLTLRGCQSVTDKSMQTFSKNCRNLEEINLDNCKQLTDETCKSLAANCHKLTHLNIAANDVTDEALEAIGEGCKLLKHINISNCNKIRPAGIESLARNCTNLVSFISVACGEETINDESLRALSHHCHKLKVINLNGCSAITDTGVKYLAENCHQLIYCCLSKCFALTDQALISLSQGCPQLKTLGLMRCHQLTDHGFQALTKICKQLQDLDLEDCVLITDLTLYHLTNNCSKLKRLALSHCDLITDEGIRYIGTNQKTAESIQYLELDNCTQLTDAAIDHLISCKNLKRLDIYDNNRISRQAIKKLYTYLPQLDIHTYFQETTPQEPITTEARQRYCRCCSIL
jgi:F-box/leucine-rich repeat protein 2/20